MTVCCVLIIQKLVINVALCIEMVIAAAIAACCCFIAVACVRNMEGKICVWYTSKMFQFIVVCTFFLQCNSNAMQLVTTILNVNVV